MVNLELVAAELTKAVIGCEDTKSTEHPMI